MSLVGPASSDVPVSKATWQPEGPQKPRGSPPRARSRMETCQNPGFVTGAQVRGELIRSSRTSPNRISLCSLSPLAKKTEKRLRVSIPFLTIMSKKEKSCASASCGRPSPRMPSKGTSLNGSSLSFVAVMKFILEHKPEMQTLSLLNTPVTCPVPKVMVTESRGRLCPPLLLALALLPLALLPPLLLPPPLLPLLPLLLLGRP
mmetsp:Transcript_55312/g.161422  ORF Transcript_55312/g.161422 Transcript_55312/m.161422 type:complete len:203 (-) Transcript_55312:545-1153(-)